MLYEVITHKNKVPYIVCGGYDLNLYYLNPSGQMVKKIFARTYSQEKPWGIEAKPGSFSRSRWPP